MMLEEERLRDEAGRTFNRFYGSPKDWMYEFQGYDHGKPSIPPLKFNFITERIFHRIKVSMKKKFYYFLSHHGLLPNLSFCGSCRFFFNRPENYFYAWLVDTPDHFGFYRGQKPLNIFLTSGWFHQDAREKTGWKRSPDWWSAVSSVINSILGDSEAKEILKENAKDWEKYAYRGVDNADSFFGRMIPAYARMRTKRTDSRIMKHMESKK